ncbi:HAD-IB family hydrolase [Campylobacter volucris]|uniref:HAD-IB family hydrolase n=1 Tax=Campylobacter volucris TaxID=1031542 RepID=A0A5C7DUD0_9BACT|nr:HAD-IB family hydrolase [Campylobacter volucris]TXE89746.1 HAD-IB family hydrolase [Campylobacter volucris]
MQSEIYAFFDFCETITNFQTLEAFLPIIKNCNPNYSEENNFKRRKEYSELDLQYPTYEVLIDCPIHKVKHKAKEFIYDRVLKNINNNILNKLFWHQDQGHIVAIVSGGLSIYIDEFANLYDIKHVVAVDLECQAGVFTGNIDGIHTMQERKLYKLSQIFDIRNIDLENSYAYSDCVSDIPLLSFVGNPYVVECGKDVRWAKLLNFNIIKGN